MLDLDGYLTQLSSAAPTPGGGSAATIVGALGVSLVAMVARITAGAPRHAERRSDAEQIAREADGLRDRLLAARTLDEAAFRSVVEAQGLPRGSDAERAERSRRLQAALVLAAEAPLGAAALCAEGLELAIRGAELRNTHLRSDIECGVTFLDAALHAGVANVRINHEYIKNREIITAQEGRVAAIVDAATRARVRALAVLEEPPARA